MYIILLLATAMRLENKQQQQQQQLLLLLLILLLLLLLLLVQRNGVILLRQWHASTLPIMQRQIGTEFHLAWLNCSCQTAHLGDVVPFEAGNDR